MKLMPLLAAGAVALTTLAAPATARTTVHRVHGPVHLLPHHDRKICQTRYVDHQRVRKCHYR